MPPEQAQEIALVDLEITDPRWDQAFPVLNELRTSLTRGDLQRIATDASAQTPRFLVAFSASGDCLGVAGWRIISTTKCGRELYVDDLVTSAAHRSTGVGRALLAELSRRAREHSCTTIELDSGVQRTDAHRFYQRERMAITSFHFAKRP